ncbi:MAG: FAD:protein FMN transferase [Elusimicrobiota bacterium]|nr:MAG: FAD:protein FMN transferase [Elusimicrobiota bacterium]
MKFNLNKTALPLLLLLTANAHGAAPQERRSVRVRWVMGTLCEIDAPGATDAAVSAAFAEIERWDRILSRYKEESELSALNRSAGKGPFRASDELYQVAALALRRAQDTGGAYDPTVLPLILGGGPRALPLVGWKKVRLDPAAKTIELPLPGMGLDFGGIGKGWALDRAADVLKAAGATSALLNFGGQVLAVGTEPGKSGWEVRVPGSAEPLFSRTPRSRSRATPSAPVTSSPLSTAFRSAGASASPCWRRPPRRPTAGPPLSTCSAKPPRRSRGARTSILGSPRT